MVSFFSQFGSELSVFLLMRPFVFIWAIMVAHWTSQQSKRFQHEFCSCVFVWKFLTGPKFVCLLFLRVESIPNPAGQTNVEDGLRKGWEVMREGVGPPTPTSIGSRLCVFCWISFGSFLGSFLGSFCDLFCQLRSMTTLQESSLFLVMVWQTKATAAPHFQQVLLMP